MLVATFRKRRLWNVAYHQIPFVDPCDEYHILDACAPFSSVSLTIGGKLRQGYYDLRIKHPHQWAHLHHENVIQATSVNIIPVADVILYRHHWEIWFVLVTCTLLKKFHVARYNIYLYTGEDHFEKKYTGNRNMNKWVAGMLTIQAHNVWHTG